MSPVTIHNQGWHLEKVLGWMEDQSRSFDDVSLEDVDAFLASNGKQGWGRVSVASSAKAGWCAPGIAAGVEGPRLFRHEGLPVGPPWPDVRRLIAGTEGDAARDIRDRAILMLLARPKPRRVQEYPLRREAAEAILRYLQKGRPRCARREVFLTLKAPFRRLSQGARYHLVSTRLGALGIHVPRRGPHSLRHACAGHLLGEGFSLKEIGDHLGHRGAYATRIYAKVDLAGLREVAALELGGLR